MAFENINLGDFFLHQITNATKIIIISTNEPLASSILLLVKSILILSLVGYGIRFMLGDIASTGKQLAITCVWCLFGMGVIEPSFYFGYIVTPLTYSMHNLTGLFLTGSAEQTAFQAIGNSFETVFRYALLMIKEGGIYNLVPVLVGSALCVIYGLYYAAATIVILMSQIGLSLFWIFGIIVIPISAFQMFRGMFKAWVVAIFKYSMVMVVVSCLLTLLNQVSIEILLELLGDMSNSDGAGGIADGALLLNGLFGFALISKAIEITAELTGGIASDTSGAFRASGSAIKGAVGAGKFGAKHGSSNGMKALKHHFRDMA